MVKNGFCPLFSSVWIYPGETLAGVVYMASLSSESRRNRMFWFADLNGISNQAYRN